MRTKVLTYFLNINYKLRHANLRGRRKRKIQVFFIYFGFVEQRRLFTVVEKSLLFLFTMSFISLYCVLSYNNRPAADDFYYLGNISDKGVWGCMKELYFGYSGRWAAYLFTGWIASMSAFRYYLLVFNIITFFSLAAILYELIKIIFSKNINIFLPNSLYLLYSFILTSTLFFSSYSIGETWFWLVQVCTYLWSIIMSLLLLYIILEEQYKGFHIPIIIIAAAFIGGASESYALVNIFLLSAYLLVSNGRFKKYPGRNQKIILSLTFLLLSFAVTMLAPGNEVRLGLLPKVSFSQSILIQLKSFIKIYLIKTPPTLHYLFLFSFPWFVLGKYFSDPAQKQNLTSLLASLKNYVLLLTGLIFIFLIPTSYIMSELGPDRALSQISFLFAFSFAVLFFYLGRKMEIRENIFKVLKVSTLTLSVLIMFYQVSNQYLVTRKYAAEVDKRIEFLKESDKTTGKNTIELEPLPFSGMLYSAEISGDTNDFRNQFLKKYVGIEKELRVK